MRKKIYTLAVLLILINKNICAENIHEKSLLFSVNVDTLNMLTVEYKNNRATFENTDYSEYLLYRAIIINDFILNDFKNENLAKYFCQKENENLIKLLKWKVTKLYTQKELLEYDISCIEEIKLSTRIMEDYFLDLDYVDAFVEYYKYEKASGNNNIIELWSVLNTNLYKTPNIKIAELLINAQHDIFLKTGKRTGEWNISVIAAKYGSKVGITNMIYMIDKDTIDYNFLLRVLNIWK